MLGSPQVVRYHGRSFGMPLLREHLWEIMARLIATAFLASLFLIVVIAPGSVTHVTGFHRLGTLSAEGLGFTDAAEDRSSPRFLKERGRVRLTVEEAQSLGELVDRYQISTPFIRRQIAEQVGSPSRHADDQLPIPAGQTLVLELNEVARR